MEWPIQGTELANLLVLHLSVDGLPLQYSLLC